MPNRVIKDSVRQSAQIDSLTWFQEVVFYRLIVTVDDFGRYYANPQIIKSELFPTKEDLAKKDVLAALDKLEEVGLIQRYEYDGTQYLQFVKWERHQQRRATKSKFPDSNGNHLISIDINCNQKKSDDVKRHQKKSDDSNGNHLSPYTRIEYENENENEAALISIQQDHEEVFEEARKIGLPLSDQNMNNLVDLYAEYGKEALMYGISESGTHNKVSIAYIRSVCKNYGKVKPQEEDELPDINTLVY